MTVFREFMSWLNIIKQAVDTVENQLDSILEGASDSSKSPTKVIESATKNKKSINEDLSSYNPNIQSRLSRAASSTGSQTSSKPKPTELSPETPHLTGKPQVSSPSLSGMTIDLKTKNITTTMDHNENQNIATKSGWDSEGLDTDHHLENTNLISNSAIAPALDNDRNVVELEKGLSVPLIPTGESRVVQNIFGEPDDQIDIVDDKSNDLENLSNRMDITADKAEDMGDLSVPRQIYPAPKSKQPEKIEDVKNAHSAPSTSHRKESLSSPTNIEELLVKRESQVLMAKTENAELHETVANLNSQIEELTNELDELRTTSSSAINVLKMRCKELESRLTDNSTNQEGSKDQVTLLNRALGDKQASIQGLLQEGEQLAKDILKANNTIKKLKKEKDALQVQFTELEQHSVALEQKIEKLNSEIKALQDGDKAQKSKGFLIRPNCEPYTKQYCFSKKGKRA